VPVARVGVPALPGDLGAALAVRAAGPEHAGERAQERPTHGRLQLRGRSSEWAPEETPETSLELQLQERPQARSERSGAVEDLLGASDRPVLGRRLAAEVE